jgi:DNA-binding MarR family transcriptional regulator
MIKTEKELTDFIIVNKTTGEITKELCKGDRIVTKEQSEYAEKHIINFNRKVPFVKVYLCECNELYDDLTGTEVIVISSLINYISYDDNILRIDKKPMKIKDIAELVHKDYTNMKKLISSLEKKEVIKKIKWFDEKRNKEMSCIAVNPFLFFRGNDIRKEIIEVFSNSKWSKIDYKRW